MVVLATVTGGGLLYLRVFKGWKLGDLMYVTKASLQQSVGAVSSGAQLAESWKTQRSDCSCAVNL